MARGHRIAKFFRVGRRIGKALLPLQVRSPIYEALSRSPEEQLWSILQRALKHPEPEWMPGPLVVSGLIEEAKGVSEAARLTVAGLISAGLNPIAHDVRPILDQAPGGANPYPVKERGGVWLLHINAPECLHVLTCFDPEDWRGRYRIGYWAWELPRLPSLWRRVSKAFDEIWVPSKFIADAAKVSGVRSIVRVMPHPVGLGPHSSRRNRHRFELQEDVVCVLALGDLNSSADRKNLLGAVEIYMRAFPKDSGTSVLVVKTQSEIEHPQFPKEALEVAKGRRDIRFLFGTRPYEEVRALIASCDVLLSPHRSEGFGLSLAEAFFEGVPVLATGWSGNLDFMRGIPDLLIGYSLVPVLDRSGIYRANRQKWAAPDLDDAAVKLRSLVLDPQLRNSVAQEGRKVVLEQAKVWKQRGAFGSAMENLVRSARRSRPDLTGSKD